MSRKIFVFLVYFSINFIFTFQSNDNFNEELYIKELPTNNIYTYFQFTTKWNRDENDNWLHTNLTPRPIAELINLYGVRELHVSLTHGMWKYETWGYPTLNAATGAEVWAWFDDPDNKLSSGDIDQLWRQLCSSLSGLLCASFSFIDQSNTLEPKFSFRPTYNVKSSNDSSHIRYGSLPHEIVCTENLTPWKKLLPGNSKEGLGSLLNSDQIYSTNYHSLGIHVRQLCDYTDSNNCERSTLEIKQSVNLVFDPLISSDNKAKKRDWSLRKLFGLGLNGASTLANTTKIYVDVTDANFEIAPSPTNATLSQRGGSDQYLIEYDIKILQVRHKMINIAVVQNEEQKGISIIPPPPLYAKRFLLGVGQERGQIVTKVVNSHWAPLNVIFQENIPWFVPVYLHTLSLKVGDREIQPTTVKYIPGELRKRPYQLEVGFRIPARSSMEISIDFDYIFLKWLEYPPDANHGHYIGSAVLTSILPVARNYTSVPIDGSLFRDGFNASRPGYIIHIYTESLLITLPTPDFSMPYNVICLACTVVALAFGPIHNIATKKLMILKQDEPKSFLGKLKLKLFKKKEKSE